MSIKPDEKLHIWASDVCGVDVLPGPTVVQPVPEWLIQCQVFDPESVVGRLEDYRLKMRQAFEVIWVDAKVNVAFESELRQRLP